MMKPNQEKYNFIWTLILGLWAIGIQAQTTNTGTIYVSPDTEFSTVEDFDNTATGEFYNDGEAFIYADFNNDGTVDFFENTGLTRFQGAQIQEIRGSNFSYFYKVLFDNPSSQPAFHLYGTMSISDEARFSNGIVKDDDFGGLMIFEEYASQSQTSDDSHVDGLVQKNGSGDFRYPIGDGGYYRFAEISSPTNSAAIFSGKYYLENSNALYPHEQKTEIIELIDKNEYWTIEREASEEYVMISLSWHNYTTPGLLINAAQENALHIVRWDVENQLWVDEGGVANMDEKTVTTAVNAYGVFTLARVTVDNILPCELVVYNAVTPNNDGVNDYFRIDQSNNTCADNIHVEVFNRWGVKVFETDHYGDAGNVFDGYSTGRLTVDDSQQLPTGTYFYILTYDYLQGQGSRQFKKAGYLYLSGN